jgi:hypothetical protein
MSITTYPRVETIVVPDNVKREFIGRYASARASEILDATERGAIIPRSASLRPIEARLYALTYDSTVSSTLPKEVDIFSTDGAELPEVVSDQVATRNQGGPGKLNSVRGSK